MMLGDCRVDNLLPSVVLRELQVVVRHEEAQGYQGPVGLGREAFQA
jgi:hypothetical protein